MVLDVLPSNGLRPPNMFAPNTDPSAEVWALLRADVPDEELLTIVEPGGTEILFGVRNDRLLFLEGSATLCCPDESFLLLDVVSLDADRSFVD